MRCRIRWHSLAATVALLMATGATLLAQDIVQQARDLYAAAAYEDALAVLSRQQNDKQPLEIARYRALCLIALNRTAEAEQAIRDILVDDPLYSFNDAAPRVVEFFARVKRQAIPQLARTLYSDGKSAMDRKSTNEAVRKFEHLLQLTDGADTRDSVLISELRLLAAGFLELVRAKSPAEKPTPVATTSDVVRPAPARISVTPPVTIRQNLPELPSDPTARMTEYMGTVQVTISPDGKVEAAEMMTSSDRRYDQKLLLAARTWRYVPATRDGVAIRYEKLVKIHLRSETR
jgi:TonB family protein